MDTINVTLLSELPADKHLIQAKKILSQVGELFNYSINIKSSEDGLSVKGNLSSFQHIVRSCQESDAAILCMEEDEKNKSNELKNELGIITRYSEDKHEGNRTCAIFEPLLRSDNTIAADLKNAKAYINALALLFDHTKVSEASILLQKACSELITENNDLSDYADLVVEFVRKKLVPSKLTQKELERDEGLLLSWGG